MQSKRPWKFRSKINWLVSLGVFFLLSPNLVTATDLHIDHNALGQTSPVGTVSVAAGQSQAVDVVANDPVYQLEVTANGRTVYDNFERVKPQDLPLSHYGPADPYTGPRDLATLLPGVGVPIEPTSLIINNDYWSIKNDDTDATNTTTGLNAALNWAVTNGFTQVRLAPGTYLIDGTHPYHASAYPSGVVMPSNLHLNLNGATLQIETNSSPSYNAISIYKVENVMVSNGTLIGDKPTHIYPSTPFTTHEFGFGVLVAASKNIQVYDLEIKSMTGDGIIVIGTDGPLASGGRIPENVFLYRNRIHDHRRQGISVVGGLNIEIINNDIFDIGDPSVTGTPSNMGEVSPLGTLPMAGVDVEGELDWPNQNILIERNNFTNTYGGAMHFHKNCLQVTFAQNYLGTNNIGIGLFYGDQLVVRENMVIGGRLEAVENTNVQNFLVEGNTFEGKSMQIAGKKLGVIRNNLFKNTYLLSQNSSLAIYRNFWNNTGSTLSWGLGTITDTTTPIYEPYDYFYSGNEVTGNYTQPEESSLATAITGIHRYNESAQKFTFNNPVSDQSLYFDFIDPRSPVTDFDFTVWNLNQWQGALLDGVDPVNNPGTSVNLFGSVNSQVVGNDLTLIATFSGISAADNVDGVVDGNLTVMTQLPTPAVDQFWSLSIPAQLLGEGQYGTGQATNSAGLVASQSGNLTRITLSDAMGNSLSYDYQGLITVKPAGFNNLTSEAVAALYSQTLTTMAGAIYFPQGSQPQLRATDQQTVLNPGVSPVNLTTDVDDYFCVNPGCWLLTNNQSHQLWYKEIGGRTYPFLVQFYDLPQEKDELRLLDTGW